MERYENRERNQRKNYYISKASAGKENKKFCSRNSNSKKKFIQRVRTNEDGLKSTIMAEYAVEQPNSPDVKNLSPPKSRDFTTKYRQLEKRPCKRQQREEWAKRLEERKSSISNRSGKAMDSNLKFNDKFKRDLGSRASRRLTISQRKPENTQKLSMDTIRKRRGYTKNTEKLSGVTCFRDYSSIHSQMERYRKLYEQALFVIGRMEKNISGEKDKHLLQKNVLLQQIKKLEGIIRTRIYLGHLYSYKQNDPQFLIPSSMIVENADENVSSIEPLSLEMCERVMKQFLEKESMHSGIESNLSLQSK